MTHTLFLSISIPFWIPFPQYPTKKPSFSFQMPPTSSRTHSRPILMPAMPSTPSLNHRHLDISTSVPSSANTILSDVTIITSIQTAKYLAHGPNSRWPRAPRRVVRKCTVAIVAAIIRYCETSTIIRAGSVVAFTIVRNVPNSTRTCRRIASTCRCAMHQHQRFLNRARGVNLDYISIY